MEKKRSKSLTLTPAEVKARRLKMLQTIEARRLELVNRQLSRAETKALRQLDFQRSQFRRRLSDVTGHPCSHMPAEASSVSFANSGECSPGDGSRARTTKYRVTRSLSKVGRSLERPIQARVPKTSTENISGSTTQETHANYNQETRPPFWIRIPSLGISSSDQTTELGSPNEAVSPNTNADSESSSANSLLASPSVSSEMGRSNSPTLTNVGNFTFPPGEQSREPGTTRVSDMRPMWLKALHKLREKRYARLHGQQAEECEELAALVTGCSLTGTLPATAKRPTIKQGAALAR
ncbi:hypothetical protein D915_008868 [Fasciola hepatica]|uniref:Uncharacterized protein n=1 Tax=Fasciola hepatica TaxID=6192 RepID=A0A4E0QY56_FASHE|nr:hypothetical protein D915_008868 [Fasciola hepatica]